MPQHPGAVWAPLCGEHPRRWCSRRTCNHTRCIIDQPLSYSPASHGPTRASTHQHAPPTPDPHPATLRTSGICSTVSAHLITRSTSRRLVRPASANDFSGNDDTFAIYSAKKTSRPSTHDFNRVNSTTTFCNTTQSAQSASIAATRPTSSLTSATVAHLSPSCSQLQPRYKSIAHVTDTPMLRIRVGLSRSAQARWCTAGGLDPRPTA